MKFILSQVFHSGKFVVGFCIFVTILVIIFGYPLIVHDPPLQIMGQGTFFPPGIYANIYDSIETKPYTLDLEGADARRIASRLSNEDRAAMKDWLVAAGVAAGQIDTANTQQLLALWAKNYDPKKDIPEMTNAKRNYYARLNNSLQGL